MKLKLQKVLLFLLGSCFGGSVLALYTYANGIAIAPPTQPWFSLASIVISLLVLLVTVFERK
jgi:hypothetical protein